MKKFLVPALTAITAFGAGALTVGANGPDIEAIFSEGYATGAQDGICMVAFHVSDGINEAFAGWVEPTEEPSVPEECLSHEFNTEAATDVGVEGEGLEIMKRQNDKL